MIEPVVPSAEDCFGGFAYESVGGIGGGSGGVVGGAGLGECVRETEREERSKVSLKNVRAFLRKPDIVVGWLNRRVRE